MTVHVPKWAIYTIAALIAVGIGAGAYLLGRSDSDDDAPVASTVATTTEETVEEEPVEEPPPPCTKRAAQQAAKESEFEGFVRDLGAVPAGEPLFEEFGYGVGDLICRDLTGDGAEEMVVQLVCCTGSSPSPWAIFVAEHGEWELAFHRDNIQAVLSVEGDELVEKSPAYGAQDPTCCPSTFRFGRIAWDGSEFVFESEDADPDRTITAGSQGVTRVGGFKPQTGTPLDATKVFGPPNYVGPDGELCLNEWRDLGLVINFVNFGGVDPCGVDGAVGSIEVGDVFAEQAGWETDEGVRVGMSLDEVVGIYPDARFESLAGQGRFLVLIEGPSVIGAGGTSPIVAARIADETVEELRLEVGAGGD